MSEEAGPSLVAVVERCLQRLGNAPIVIDEHERLSYNDLVEAASLIAGKAHAISNRTRPHIAALMDNRWEYLAVDLACAAYGCVLVRLNARDTVTDISHILRHSDTTLLVCGGERGSEATAACAAAREAGHEIETLRLAERDQRHSLEDLRDALGPGVRPAAFVDAGGSTLYRLMYTSGSTGTPKGVMVTHRQWHSAVLEHLLRGPLADITGNHALLHITPLSHVSGGLFWPFAAVGAHHVIARSPHVDDIAAAAERNKPTHAFMVPTLVKRMVDAGDALRDTLASLQRIYYAAAPIAPDTLRAALELYGPVFAQGYGSTEAMWWLTYFPPEAHADAMVAGNMARLASCGQPSVGVPVAVLDDDGREVDCGDIGEVATRGPHVAAEYWKAGEVPREGGRRDGWFRTGDTGSLDHDGFLTLMDRKSDLIITGGFNTYPREVEMVLEQDPRIQECCVVGAPDPDWGEVVTAVVVPAAHVILTEQDVIDFARLRVADYKRPRKVILTDRLPETSAGKRDRKAIRAALWADQGRSV